MNYNESIDYIEKIISINPKPGLERIKTLMEILDNPQEKLNIIHVAGTNGKGSTCAMLESILRNVGYSTGLYTSPHLIKYNERMRINNTDINDDNFAKIASRVAAACSKMQTHPSIFEFLTAMAFCYFELNKLDFVILEVGIGGRLDSTNIIQSPILTIITSIGVDHTKYLGNTIAQISSEKGGIIKESCPTVLCFNSDEVYNVIKDICVQRNSKLYYNHSLDIDVIYDGLDKMIFSIKTSYYKYLNIILNIIGEYQIYNTATVLTAIKALSDIGFTIPVLCILNGLKNTRWAGRMEIISKDPYIILDGAHNIDGINMLSKYIQTHLLAKRITLLMGVLKDKEYTKMIDKMMTVVSKLVITQPMNSSSFTIEEFSHISSKYNIEMYSSKDISKALDIAKDITQKDNIILCTGSLYLVGKVRSLILRRNNND